MQFNDANTATDYIKEQLINYLRPAPNYGFYICPICRSGTGKGKGQPDGALKIGRDTLICKCFSCGFSGDIIDLIGAEYGIEDAGEKFKKAYEIFGVDFTSSFNGSNSLVFKKNIEGDVLYLKNETMNSTWGSEASEGILHYLTEVNNIILDCDEAKSYLSERGIGIEIIKRFCIGYDSHWRHPDKPSMKASKRIIIPTGGNSYVARAIEKTTDDRYKIIKFGMSGMLGSDLLFNGSVAPFFVVEGEFDVLSLYEVGAEGLSLGSVSNVRKFVKLLEENKDKITRPLIICMDNDDAGSEAQKRLSEALKSLGVLFIQEDINCSYKDVNDALRGNREVFCEAVAAAEINAMQLLKEKTDFKTKEEKAEFSHYIGDNAAKHLSDLLKKIEISKREKPIQTGFKQLDYMLEGGFTDGLVFIGAMSSIGKTAFVMQIADFVASEGQDVLVFSLEMPKTELMARSISRLTYELCGGRFSAAKTVKGITLGHRHINYTAEEKELINKAFKRYREIGKNIRIFEENSGEPIGIMHVEECIRKHIKLTGKKPLIIIDYIQIMEPLDARASDKQNIDRAVKQLKQLSRDFEVTIIGICSFNRDNYNKPVSMEAFKESGAIEYSSDILLGMQLKGMGTSGFDLNEARNKEPREIELKVLKNRSGRAGGAVEFVYHAKFGWFGEM